MGWERLLNGPAVRPRAIRGAERRPLPFRRKLFDTPRRRFARCLTSLPQFFTVDALGTYHTGLTLGLIPQVHPTPADDFQARQIALLQQLYPRGWSRHGNAHLGHPLPENAWHEAVAELVRMYEFPERPSRYQCVFGSETLAEAEAFRAQYRPPAKFPQACIWEVECAQFFRADMKMVPSAPFARGVIAARHYWNGETTEQVPVWEVLMRPPVQIIHRVS